MPDIGVFHPQIVHFVIALLFVGVILRLVSVLPIPPKLSFISPAATLLIVVGTIAAVAAAKSGDQAHGPAERPPNARAAVVNHEDWGNRTRNMFLIVAVVEIAALVLSRKEQWKKSGRIARAVAGGLGAIGLFFLYETGEHGGEVVYSYAGGVGTRSGDPEDVERLLVAALYHNAVKDREAGRKEDAARLIDEMARRAPDDFETRMLLVESQIKDRGDARTALNLLNASTPPTEDRLKARAGLLRVEAFEALGQADSAQAILTALKQTFPDNQRVQERQLEVKAVQPPARDTVMVRYPTTTTTGE